MNRHGVLDTSGVSARENDDERGAALADRVEDQAVSPPQPLPREPEPPQLIVLVWIGASQVEHAFRTARHYLRERLTELLQVHGIVRSAGVITSAYGWYGEYCKVGGFGSSNVATYATVYCFDYLGQLAPANFTINYSLYDNIIC